MSSAKKYINEPITYSSTDRLLDTKLFQEIGQVFSKVKRSKGRKSELTGLRKILIEKKLK